MVRFFDEFAAQIREHRDPAIARELNPKMHTFREWIAVIHGQRQQASVVGSLAALAGTKLRSRIHKRGPIAGRVPESGRRYRLAGGIRCDASPADWMSSTRTITPSAAVVFDNSSIDWASGWPRSAMPISTAGYMSMNTSCTSSVVRRYLANLAGGVGPVAALQSFCGSGYCSTALSRASPDCATNRPRFSTNSFNGVASC